MRLHGPSHLSVVRSSPRLDVTGFAPAVHQLHHPSRVAHSKVWNMCDAPTEEAPAEEAAASVLDSLSAGNAELMEKIKGMTLLEASELIKEVESTFDVGPKSDDDDADDAE